MSHELEIAEDGTVSMAWAGTPPWHEIGDEVPRDLTPVQMLKAAHIDWTVEKLPATVKVGKLDIPTGKFGLVRSSDNKVLDIVTGDWEPVQNEEAFEFFNDFIAAGDMEMHTAGSLKGGQIIWGLAKVKDSFELFGGDTVDSYLLFTNFHKYGFSTDVRFTPIRTVCWNTLSLALGTKVERAIKFTHRRKFDAELAKVMLGVAHEKLMKYKEMAAYLGSKQAKGEDIVEYFKRVFPVTGPKGKDSTKPMSKNALLAMDVLHTQPGHDFAEGSWWQPFNAVTFLTDHRIGRAADTRLTSAWYGYGQGLKTKALELAVDMANA